MASIVDIEIKINANLKAALEDALMVIAQYEMDIRNAQETIDIDLVEKGFCQGVWYKSTADRIKRKLKTET